MSHSASSIHNSSFPRYARYKDSGVEWLGEIPEHWEVRRNLGVFDERKECNQPNEELLSVTVSRGIIRQSEITVKKDSSNEDKSKYKVVRIGDLAYNKMRAWQGSIGISAYNGIVSPAYVVLSPRTPILSKYFHYLFRTPQFITEANRLSYGLCDDMNSLRYEHFKTSYSPIPPNDEIERIVTFLDKKTAEIDTLIAKKQRQIELLDEQKAILINHAVTRGLNPNAKLKPSGIEWLGDIPEHWSIKPLRWFCQICSGDFMEASQSSSKPSATNCVPIFGGNGLMGYTHTSNSPPHTMVLGRVGALCGNVHVTTASTWVTDNALILSVKSPFQLAYSKLALRCLDLNRLAAKNAQPLITGSTIKAQYLPLPPSEEQRSIAKTISELAKQFNETHRGVEQQIESLRNLRSTLIAHAVTGKIKI